MALVFQYGSNMSAARLNSAERLAGDAQLVGQAISKEEFEFVFDVQSQKGYAVASIEAGHGQKIWGVVYNVPDFLITRGSAKGHNRKSLDAIEAEGKNYRRIPINLRWPDGRSLSEPVITYVGMTSKSGIRTSFCYVEHILKGLEEHHMPSKYVAYVKARILANNPRLRPQLFRNIFQFWVYLGRRLCRRMTYRVQPC